MDAYFYPKYIYVKPVISYSSGQCLERRTFPWLLRVSFSQLSHHHCRQQVHLPDTGRVLLYYFQFQSIRRPTEYTLHDRKCQMMK